MCLEVDMKEIRIKHEAMPNRELNIFISELANLLQDELELSFQEIRPLSFENKTEKDRLLN